MLREAIIASSLAGMMAVAVPAALQAQVHPAVATGGGSAAKAFVDGIYRGYERTGRRPPEDGRLFTPELAALIARDGAIAARQGGSNLIDYGLLCQCNDDEGIHYVTSVTRALGSTVFIHVAKFHGGKPYTEPFDIKVIATAAGWRIADMMVARRPSLLTDLRQGLSGKSQTPQTPQTPQTASGWTAKEWMDAGCRDPGSPVDSTVPCDRYVRAAETRIVVRGAAMREGVNPQFPVTSAKGGEQIEVFARVHSQGMWYVGGRLAGHVLGDGPSEYWIPLGSTTPSSSAGSATPRR